MTAQRFREFKMPDVGEGLTEAEILKWYVAPGDTVHDGQIVCEVETAKAAVELPIPFDGVVHELHFTEGTTVDVGTSIISVDTDPSAAPAPPSPAASGASDGGPAAQVPDQADQAAGGSTPAPKEPREERQSVLVGYGPRIGSAKRRPRRALGTFQPAAPPPRVPERVPNVVHTPPPSVTAIPPTPALAAVAGSAAANGSGAAPVLAKPPVRKLAKDLGVDLASVRPTGPGGIITREDVHAHAAALARAAAQPQPVEAESAAEPVAPAAPAVAAPEARETRIPIKGVRKATAQAMVSSAFTAPHVTEFITVDITRTMKLVQKLKQDPDMDGVRVSPLLLVARAFLIAIRRNPEVNASWDEENQEIVRKEYVNLGIAAATPRGLLVPNVKDAHRMTLAELARALADLVTTAREGRTTPADMQGGTVTVTNVGVFGVDSGTPILNPGESAILAFGAVKDQPWVHKGKVVPRKVTTLALSFDHRLVDGELGSKVLADTAAVLEHPRRLVTWA